MPTRPQHRMTVRQPHHHPAIRRRLHHRRRAALRHDRLTRRLETARSTPPTTPDQHGAGGDAGRTRRPQQHGHDLHPPAPLAGPPSMLRKTKLGLRPDQADRPPSLTRVLAHRTTHRTVPTRTGNIITDFHRIGHRSRRAHRHTPGRRVTPSRRRQHQRGSRVVVAGDPEPAGNRRAR